MRQAIFILMVIIFFHQLTLADIYKLEIVGREAFGSARAVYITGSYAYLCAGGSLVILDLKDPADPYEVGRINTPGLALSVYVSNDYAYVADAEDGLRIIDVSNPGSPKEMGFYGTPGEALGLYVSGGYAYVADGDLRTIDVSDPGNPKESEYYYITPGEAWGVHVAEGYAYVTDEKGGIRIIDVSDPKKPEETGFFNTDGKAKRIYVSGNRAYAIVDFGYYDRGFHIDHSDLLVMDISEPENPKKLGAWSITGGASTIQIAGRYAYYGTVQGIHVADISDPGNIREVGFCNTFDGRGVPNGIHLSYSYAYIAKGQSGILVIDVSDPVNPRKVGSCATPGFAREIYVSGKYAYVADKESGLRIVDISDPKNPVEVGFYDTPGWALGVCVSNGFAYVADMGSGLRMIDVSDPRNPKEVGSCYTQKANAVYVDGGCIYVVGESVCIVQISQEIVGKN